ncbi:hypothetical protein [Streptomyces sp. NPDC020597]|uniref:hypothetical protein n=1 Tax=Streptomyces sp. NPDC020597 TaxID=3365080 RepID=UPI0037AE8950
MTPDHHDKLPPVKGEPQPHAPDWSGKDPYPWGKGASGSSQPHPGHHGGGHDPHDNTAPQPSPGSPAPAPAPVGDGHGSHGQVVGDGEGGGDGEETAGGGQDAGAPDAGTAAPPPATDGGGAADAGIREEAGDRVDGIPIIGEPTSTGPPSTQTPQQPDSPIPADQYEFRADPPSAAPAEPQQQDHATSTDQQASAVAQADTPYCTGQDFGAVAFDLAGGAGPDTGADASAPPDGDTPAPGFDAFTFSAPPEAMA